MAFLDIAQDHNDGAVILHATGEVDSATVDQLADALAAGLAAAAGAARRLLVVALDAVTYFGSAGLNAVLGCYEQGLAEGVAVRVVASNAEVLRPIEVTKLDGMLRPHPTVADALTSGPG